MAKESKKLCMLSRSNLKLVWPFLEGGGSPQCAGPSKLIHVTQNGSCIVPLCTGMTAALARQPSAFSRRGRGDSFLHTLKSEQLAVISAQYGTPEVQRSTVCRACAGLAVSNGWWESFCRHHPTLSLRNAAPLSFVWAHAYNPDVVCQYFDLLERTME